MGKMRKPITSNSSSRLEKGVRLTMLHRLRKEVATILFFALKYFVPFGPFIVSLFMVSAHRAQSPLVLRQSSERVFREAGFVRSAVASRDGHFLYVLIAGRGSVTVYEEGRDFSRDIPTLSLSPDALAVDARGRIYLADTEADQIAILDPFGQRLRTFRVPRPLSLAVLSDGRIVVASPTEGALLHLYDPAGRRFRSFGALKLFDETNPVQNRFLDRGRVLVDAADNIYYVFEFAPHPTVQKFSKEGELLSEFVIEGQAVDLQVQMARRFLAAKDPRQVGGVVTIASATLDPVTGHLWIGVNGSSRSGIVYEYSPEGEKLREYAFVLRPTLAVLVGMEEIVVRSPWIYVFTPAKAYRFHVGRGSIGDFRVLGEGDRCPMAQEWPSCETNCGTPTSEDDKDCKAALQRHVAPTMRVIQNYCTITTTSCYASVTTCDPADGNQVFHAIELDCNSNGAIPARGAERTAFSEALVEDADSLDSKTPNASSFTLSVL